MVKSSFIIPSWNYWNNPIKQQPLTQLYLSTILEEFTDTKIDLIDLRSNDKKEVSERDLFFYSFTSPDVKEMISLSTEIKQKYPHSKHIAGGVHTSYYPKMMSNYFDAVVIGKGEESIIGIIQDYHKGRIKPVYEYESKPNNYYPFSRRDFLPKERIIASLFKSREIPSTTASFSQGCPYKCGFCANFDPQRISRSPLDKIVREIEYLKSNYNIKGISLTDDVCIPLNEKQAQVYLEEIGKTGINWRGQTRIGIPENILRLAKQSGCLELAFGVESASQECLIIVNKKINLNTVRDTIEKCRKVGIWSQICLINGLPFEPENIVDLTKKFVKETNPNSVVLCSLVVYPGSDLFNNPHRYDIKSIDTDYTQHHVLINRFKEEKKNNSLNFKYGSGFSEEKILANLFELQNYLISEGYNK